MTETSLCGLWKDSRLGVLIQLHGATVFMNEGSAFIAESLKTIKCVARIMKTGRGEFSTMRDRTVTLTSVMPKRDFMIKIVDASPRGPTMWDIEGVVTGIPNDADATAWMGTM